MFFVGLVRDHRRDHAPPSGVAICFARVAFVANGGARRYVRPDVEQRLEMPGVGGFASGQVEGYDVA